MEDHEIVELFWQRDESAIAHTTQKYNSYCMRIAKNILYNNEDSEECVNDAYLALWNSIPPSRPSSLSAYLAKITRNLSLNMYKAQHTAKRGGGEFAVSLDELDECIPDKMQQESSEQLGKRISEFLYTCSEEARKIFVRRYFFSDSISDIAEKFDMSESKVKSMLHRTRKSLKHYLCGFGIIINTNPQE